MKFIINGAKLNESIQHIASIVSTNNAMPAVENYMLALKDNFLVIRGTDLETMIEVKLELESFEAGDVNEVLVEAKLFGNLLSQLSSFPLTINVDDANLTVEIVAGTGKYKIAGLPIEGFPEPKELEEPQMTTFTSRLLVNAIEKTSFATSTDDLRPQMTGVFCKQTADYITFVATDAHKMVRYRNMESKSDDEFSFILPKKPLTIISKIISSFNEELEIVTRFNYSNVCFEFANYVFFSRLKEGQYPNYDAAIPKDNPNKLIVDRQMFLSGIKRAAILADPSTKQIRLILTTNQLVVVAANMGSNEAAKDTINCSYEGDKMEIGFNATYLIEMLSTLDTPNVLLEMSQPNRAGVMTPYEEQKTDNKEDVLMLLMPINLID
ncbi:MAG: DNA polymerase III subunit beta [Bacteroidales bacterium]|jgi:DNA polymerase-3 subunit beta|nr:DNA polymerase III subunit beta [Bacteroidales bacterium]